MTLKDARRLLDEVRAAAAKGDAEVAHAKEDDLHTAVLLAIAAGAPNALGLAAIALQSREIKFGRHCS